MSSDVAGLPMVVTSPVPVSRIFGIRIPFPLGVVNVFPVFRSRMLDVFGVPPELLMPTFWPGAANEIIDSTSPMLRCFMSEAQGLNRVIMDTEITEQEARG